MWARFDSVSWPMTDQDNHGKPWQLDRVVGLLISLANPAQTVFELW
jgi:hypothetical protein